MNVVEKTETSFLYPVYFRHKFYDFMGNKTDVEENMSNLLTLMHVFPNLVSVNVAEFFTFLLNMSSTADIT